MAAAIAAKISIEKDNVKGTVKLRAQSTIFCIHTGIVLML